MIELDGNFTLDVHELVQAIEGRNVRGQIPLYADEAEVQVIDPHHPPCTPLTLRGKNAIAAWITDICSINMTHQVVDLIRAGNMVAFTEEGRYSDGAAVVSTSIIELHAGLIIRQRVVLVWDDID